MNATDNDEERQHTNVIALIKKNARMAESLSKIHY
jgi:hypothetical protein